MMSQSAAEAIFDERQAMRAELSRATDGLRIAHRTRDLAQQASSRDALEKQDLRAEIARLKDEIFALKVQLGLMRQQA